ncbi:formimidoylglutamate deiminase [Rhizobium sp. SG_E_25_P2]|uniref:formimidoylglutamate deiminase n=1 Tax=Rhizobium sp. SG_E_25_P2 TaxID=2879942 RepID=UPI0024735EA9|nr:formimidoylglutamate deiminase [Rhizobium sp. SG_E_25_P2]MDH6267438.1 formimidoylglutamate deiminase [Rhizobium sp. SG_E_25_P2]
MTRLHAKTALTTSGWEKDVRLTLADGRIAELETGVAAMPDDQTCDALIPAMPNLHSHAFQRAMAGLAELRGPGADNFWSWRSIMYKFALTMTPDDMEAVAAQLYMEMLEAGFGRVGEFHYVHHDKDGAAYADIGELANRIMAASSETGIHLTLLPVFYAHSGFGGQAPIDGQRRFINSIDSYARLMEACRSRIKELPGARLGIAPHSLRAATPEELKAIIPLAEDGPIHIHISEQVKEVEDCVAWSGARPVEWLLTNMPVDNRWCLIHATHMTGAETEAMARSGAIAGLCPITEANLGDGVFPAPAFLEHGGAFGVGSDSNVLISVSEELRTLEYSQRLSLRARNVVAPAGGSTGRRLFDGALAGGSKALGAGVSLKVGDTADFVSLDLSETPHLTNDQILDHWIFAGRLSVDAVWTAGVKRVEGGRHLQRDAISRRFHAAMARLLSA